MEWSECRQGTRDSPEWACAAAHASFLEKAGNKNTHGRASEPCARELEEQAYACGDATRRAPLLYLSGSEGASPGVPGASPLRLKMKLSRSRQRHRGIVPTSSGFGSKPRRT